MSKDHASKHLWIGALTAAAIGIASTFVHRTLKNRQKEESGTFLNNNKLLGSIAGGALGVAVALLFAPKSGEALLKDISQPFTHYFKKGFHVGLNTKKRKHPLNVKKAIASKKKKVARKVNI